MAARASARILSSAPPRSCRYRVPAISPDPLRSRGGELVQRAAWVGDPSVVRRYGRLRGVRGRGHEGSGGVKGPAARARALVRIVADREPEFGGMIGERVLVTCEQFVVAGFRLVTLDPSV